MPMDTILAFLKPETQAWWEMLIVLLSDIVIKIAVPVTITLVLTLLAKYTGLKVDEKQRAKADELVGVSVNKGDQWLKKKLAEGKPPEDKNAERMKVAKDFLGPALEKAGLLKKVSGKLEDLIEAKLGQKNEKKDG
jgi:hypothetical protein